MGFKARLPLLAAALWWGSLTAIGFMAVPLLFANLPTPALAGGMAAKLFSAQTWLSLGCGVVLLYANHSTVRPEPVEGPAQASTSSARTEVPARTEAMPVRTEAWALAGLILALLVEFAVAPRIVARQNLALWHSAGSAMYLAQWACAVIALWKLSRVGAS
ncbi:DUF4149 domain-containing protein [Ramlibacter sp.]|uniref:DUF4149 domain-containing protein n=1 Tax=Ramlibacter sp. TaxID=1917967 RepID=UPI001856A8A5|nr:DUF4149 domain-containing protein [Ramlibacter sp.]MBA2674531.1 DUF4149 domain-containing protein [Ramlibacter sp.]